MKEVYHIGQYTYRLSPGTDGYYVEFEVFHSTGETVWEKGVSIDPPRRNYERKDSRSSNDQTDNIDEAQRMLEGSVKWDGCSNIQFFPDDGAYTHFCGKNGAMEIGQVLATVYDLARVMMGDTVCDVGLYEGT